MTVILFILCCFSSLAGCLSKNKQECIPLKEAPSLAAVSEHKEYPYNPLVPRYYAAGVSQVERDEIQKNVAVESNQIFYEITQALGTNRVPIIGYGSLLNKKSAAETFEPETIETFTPVTGWDFQRIFNVIPPGESQRRRADDPADAWGLLNIQENPGYYFNGALYQLGREDFVKGRIREAHYNLVPIKITVAGKSEPQIAYAYAVKDQAYLRDDITPIPGYYSLVLDAVEEAGVEEEFRKTTYLADGKCLYYFTPPASSSSPGDHQPPQQLEDKSREL